MCEHRELVNEKETESAYFRFFFFFFGYSGQEIRVNEEVNGVSCNAFLNVRI